MPEDLPCIMKNMRILTVTTIERDSPRTNVHVAVWPVVQFSTYRINTIVGHLPTLCLDKLLTSHYINVILRSKY